MCINTFLLKHLLNFLFIGFQKMTEAGHGDPAFCYCYFQHLSDMDFFEVRSVIEFNQWIYNNFSNRG